MLEDVMIAPSILSADIANLAADLDAISTADYVHVDVMDGHFVPNLTFGVNVVKAVKANTSVPADVHLMISNPDEMAVEYARAGADIVSFHAEAATHANRIVAAIHEAGAKAGIVINPATPVSALEAIIEDVDLVLVMSVNPGFGGQKFIPNSLRKVSQVRALASEHGVSPIIEVDGGCSAAHAAGECGLGVGGGAPPATAAELAEAGATMLVAGSAVYGKSDRSAAIAEIREAARAGIAKRA